LQEDPEKKEKVYINIFFYLIPFTINTRKKRYLTLSNAVVLFRE